MRGEPGTEATITAAAGLIGALRVPSPSLIAGGRVLPVLDSRSHSSSRKRRCVPERHDWPRKLPTGTCSQHCCDNYHRGPEENGQQSGDELTRAGRAGHAPSGPGSDLGLPHCREPSRATILAAFCGRDPAGGPTLFMSAYKFSRPRGLYLLTRHLDSSYCSSKERVRTPPGTAITAGT